jgi:hypothetical protein
MTAKINPKKALFLLILLLGFLAVGLLFLRPLSMPDGSHTLTFEDDVPGMAAQIFFCKKADIFF